MRSVELERPGDIILELRKELEFRAVGVIILLSIFFHISHKDI